MFPVIFVLATSLIYVSDAEDYCITEAFEPKCNDSSVIVMESALFGRPDVGRCISSRESLGCYNDVISHMDYACSGKRECSVQVIKLEEKNSAPCLKDYKNFLEAEYTCEMVNTERCASNESRPLPLRPNTMVSPSQGAGTPQCPWHIEVQRGQRVILDLLDFTLSVVVSEVYDGRDPSKPCPVYLVVINNDGLEELVYLCSVSVRHRAVYTSRGHIMDFYMNINATLLSTPYYLFTYSVQGCPELVPPAKTQMKSDDLSAEVYCNLTGETWFLVCGGNTWKGQIGNCTEPIPVETTPAPTAGFPYVTSPCGDGSDSLINKKAILIAVAIGIGVGIVVGLILLGIVFGIRHCHTKRVKKRQQKGPRLSNIDIPHGPKMVDGDPPAGPSRVDHRPSSIPGHGHPYQPGSIHSLPPPQNIPHAVHAQQMEPLSYTMPRLYPGEQSVISHIVPHQYYPHAHEQALAQYPGHPHMYPSLERGTSLRQSQVGHCPDNTNYNGTECKSLDRKNKSTHIEMHTRPQSSEAIYNTYDGSKNIRY